MSGLPSVSYNKINDPFPDRSRGLLRDGQTGFFMFVFFSFFFPPATGRLCSPALSHQEVGVEQGCSCPSAAALAASSSAPSPPTSLLPPGPSPPARTSRNRPPALWVLLASLGKLPCRGCKGSQSGLHLRQQQREDERFPKSTSPGTQTTQEPQSLSSEWHRHQKAAVVSKHSLLHFRLPKTSPWKGDKSRAVSPMGTAGRSQRRAAGPQPS